MNNISMHELAFSLPVNTTTAAIPQLFADLFGLQAIDPEEIKQPKGRNGYLDVYSLKGAEGAELIAVCCRGTGNLRNSTHVLIHGEALEAGGLDIQAIAAEVIARNGWGTSGHLALDDIADRLPWEEIKACCAFDAYRDRLITRLCRPNKQSDNEPYLLTGKGESLYLGSKRSDTRILFYTQRGHIRCELRLSNRGQVTDLITRIATGDNIGPIASGLLRHNLVFVEAGFRRKDRRTACQWWLDFLDNVEALTLPRKRDAQHRSPWYVPPDPVKRREKQLRQALEGKHGERMQQMLIALAAECSINY